MRIASDLPRFEELAAERGLAILNHGHGHLQITGGPLLVNYYPEGKYQSAYVAGTKGGKRHVTPEKAIEMCFIQPSGVTGRDRRPRKTRKIRAKMLKQTQHQTCKWCGVSLTLDSSTLEHIIPLAIGGLNNANNYALACKNCNRNRGSEMPELSKQNIVAAIEKNKIVKVKNSEL